MVASGLDWRFDDLVEDVNGARSVLLVLGSVPHIILSTPRGIRKSPQE